jgi:hypothetical protein
MIALLAGTQGQPNAGCWVIQDPQQPTHTCSPNYDGPKHADYTDTTSDSDDSHADIYNAPATTRAQPPQPRQPAYHKSDTINSPTATDDNSGRTTTSRPTMKVSEQTRRIRAMKQERTARMAQKLERLRAAHTVPRIDPTPGADSHIAPIPDDDYTRCPLVQNLEPTVRWHHIKVGPACRRAL